MSEAQSFGERVKKLQERRYQTIQIIRGMTPKAGQ